MLLFNHIFKVLVNGELIVGVMKCFFLYSVKCYALLKSQMLHLNVTCFFLYQSINFAVSCILRCTSVFHSSLSLLCCIYSSVTNMLLRWSPISAAAYSPSLILPGSSLQYLSMPPISSATFLFTSFNWYYLAF